MTSTPAPPPNLVARSEPDVIIVGGGIGGLSAALGLTRRGLQVRVLERAEEFGEVGAGIQLAPNCTRILSEYGLLADATRLGVLPGNLVMRDATDGSELTRVDLVDVERRYGFPYLVIHRSDLHGLFLTACQGADVELLTGQHVVDYENTASGARVRLRDGTVHHAALVIAADGLNSVARELLVGDRPVESAYVAYRGTIPIGAGTEETGNDEAVAEPDVVLYVGPSCHFIRYPLRGGKLLNQVAVFRSDRAQSGAPDWGFPDELEAAFDRTCDEVRRGIPTLWRDRWWHMLDRDPIGTWVYGRIVLLGDAAHPPLQYLAQGAVMAIEDGWVLAHHLSRHRAAENSSPPDWGAILDAYEAVRVEHCRRVVLTARGWGDLWHMEGPATHQRNTILRSRDTYDYSFTDWIFGPTAVTPDQEPVLFDPIPLTP